MSKKNKITLQQVVESSLAAGAHVSVSLVAKEKPLFYPLYRISKGNEEECLLIIAMNPGAALFTALKIWEKRGVTIPETIHVKRGGTVDFIPKMDADHWEEIPAMA